MNTTLCHKKQTQSGGTLFITYIVVMAIVCGVIAGLVPLVSNTATLAGRRSSLDAAQQFAEGGAVIACSEFNTAVMKGGSIKTNLLTAGNPYTLSTALSTAQSNVFVRTIAAPFTSQSVDAQIWITNTSTPKYTKIITVATVGSLVQTSKMNLRISWGFPAAIVSVNAGVAGGGATQGNVDIDGKGNGPLVVDGGPALAVMANGWITVRTNFINPPTSAYSATNWGTANQIPDYTAQGTANTLFDFNRFIAVADLTPNGPSPNTNNHFTNYAAFVKAASNSTPASPLQGVIVVDMVQADAASAFSTAMAPHGINVKGTLMFNFLGTGWSLNSEKYVMQATMNINAADLTHVVATNPATYTTGYPPVYTDATKDPHNIDITSKGFNNFAPGDDLPALIYSVGCLDMHGAANISGVMYTPSYMEIENKVAGNWQYIKGMVLMGYGIYFQDNLASTSIISFDLNAVDNLATIGTSGKQVFQTYWEP